MPVVAGLAIPKTAPDKRAAEALVDYLTRPEVQLLTLKEVGFFPVVRARYGEDLPEGIRLLAEAVSAQSSAKDALPSLLPVGLGDKGGEFNKVYRDAFTRIVLRGRRSGGPWTRGPEPRPHPPGDGRPLLAARRPEHGRLPRGVID